MSATVLPQFDWSSRATAWFLFAIGLCASASGSSAREDRSEAIPDDLVVCVGLDLSVKVDGQVGVIRSVTSDRLLVDIDGKRRKLPLRSRISYQARRETRVGRTDAVISDLKAEPCFSPRTDPALQAVRAQSMMTDVAAQHEMAAAAAEVRSSNAQTPSPTLPRDLAPIAQDVERARVAEMNAISHRGARPNLDPSGIDMSGRGKEMGVPYDALALSFRIASRTLVDDAFLVLFSQVVAPNNPNAEVTVVMVRKLPRLGPQPRRISVQQLGLPQGFGLVDYQLHVFTGTRELLTNLADKRVEVTVDEAYQFLLWRYLNSNKGRDLPPVPVVDLVPLDFAAIVPAEAQNREVTVTVDGEGRVQRVVLNRSGTTGADAYIEATIRDLPFFPALRQGWPEPGDVVLSLRDLAR